MFLNNVPVRSLIVHIPPYIPFDRILSWQMDVYVRGRVLDLNKEIERYAPAPLEDTARLYLLAHGTFTINAHKHIGMGLESWLDKSLGWKYSELAWGMSLEGGPMLVTLIPATLIEVLQQGP